MNSILVYHNKNIVNSHVDYKSISILVTQKKEMPVLCKRGASFKPDRIIFFNLVYKLKLPSHRL